MAKRGLGSREDERARRSSSGSSKRSDARFKRKPSQEQQHQSADSPASSALNAPRRHGTSSIRFGAKANGAGDEGGDSDAELSEEDDAFAVHRRKKRKPIQKKVTFFEERRVLDLRGSELDQFQSWIEQAESEPPPVPGAGAAKKTPDGELQMFKDSRIVQVCKYPPILPIEEGKRNDRKQFAQQQQKRPHSREQSSPPRKSTRHSLDTFLRDKLSTPVANDTLTLPLLKSPTHRHPKDKAAMLRLLAECKAYVTDGSSLI